MICQNCKAAPASICITQIVDSQKTDTYLCQNCANDSAMKLQTPLGLFDVPGHLVFGSDYDRLITHADNERCDECGITYAEIQKSGKLGCADCYNVFRAKLRPIITRIHRSAQHRGKNPNGAKVSQKRYETPGAPGTPGTPGAPGASGAQFARGGKGRAQRGKGGDGGEQPGSGAPYFNGGITEPDVSARIDKLKASLTEAIRDEEYEKAAEIRDQIKALE